ncbi:Serine/threonine protein kinase [Phytophthora megakarya]|uniref:Serine/threonine protein kinase n=1 Tax=Phytophthora megakarya TaxID=4795 RepID=A0A225V803_9STRA|nr:Serine/threonine protein kinase [Phytophthora megakarya]
MVYQCRISEFTEICKTKYHSTITSFTSCPSWLVYPRTGSAKGAIPFRTRIVGKVYRGTWQGQRVVIKRVKVISASDERDFSREARVWLRALNPNIIKFYSVCHVTRPCFFVCEKATKGNLAEFLNRIWEGVDVATKLCD